MIVVQKCDVFTNPMLNKDEVKFNFLV